MATRKSSTINILEFFKNAFFPKFCFGCGLIGTYLCIACSRSLRVVQNDICPECGKSSYHGITHPRCKKIDGLDGFISFFLYEGLTKTIIMKLKYQLIYDATKDIVNAINPPTLQKVFFLKNNFPHIFFLPVPLHVKRRRNRGFNQAEKLYELIGKRIEIPMKTDLVIRKKYTIPQAHMKSKHDRAVNIVDAFLVVKDVKNKDIIICDDVWTTGSTIKELCKELKKNGAKKVYALTIARVYV